MIHSETIIPDKYFLNPNYIYGQSDFSISRYFMGSDPNVQIIIQSRLPNNLNIQEATYNYLLSFISTFLPYFLLYSAVINAPLPFPAWIMINLSDQLLIKRFLLGNVYLDGGVPGGYSDRSRPFSSIHFISLWCSLG